MLQQDTPIKYYSRIAGFLMIISILAGGFGEAYIPTLFFDSNNPAATADRLRTSELLFRAGFASYLIEAFADVCISMLFYVILKPVNQHLALLSAFFGLVSTAVFACFQLFNFASLHFALNTHLFSGFTENQTNTLMMLSIIFYSLGSGVFMGFYGIATMIRGYLIYRSRFLPRTLGILLLFSGGCFILRNFLLVLTPQFAHSLMLLPMLISVFAVSLWLLIKGVNEARWQNLAST
jgi:hypothetical protein